MEPYLLDVWAAFAIFCGAPVFAHGVANGRMGEVASGLALAVCALLPATDWIVA